MSTTGIVSKVAARVSQAVHGTKYPLYREWLADRGNKHLNFDLTHLQPIINAVQRLADGDVQAVHIKSPPRHGKSETGIKHAILWVMERFPGIECMFLTHTGTKALATSTEIRQMALELGILSQDTQAANFWKLKNGSSLRVFGAGQAIHGFNADAIFVDDPIEGQEQAESLTYRESQWTWWMGNVMMRRKNKTWIIFIYTAHHYDDLGYRVLGLQQELGWEQISLPCERTDDVDDPLLNRPTTGDARWLSPITDTTPGLFTPERYEGIKSAYLNSGMAHMWWGHFQCRPSAKEGYSIKPDNIEIIDEVPEGVERDTRAYDLASASSTKSDETVGARGCKHNIYMIVSDVLHGKWEPGARDQTIATTARLDGTQVHIRLPKDPGEAGIRTIAALSPMLDGYSYEFKPPAPLSKKARAEGFASAVNRGLVKFVKASWNQHVKDQLRQFPLGAHDDVVDALTDLYAEVMLSQQFRFAFDPNIHVYDTRKFVNMNGGVYDELALLTDEILFKRWGSLVFGTSDQQGSWLYLFAANPMGQRFVYEEIQMAGFDLQSQVKKGMDSCKVWDWKPGQSNPIFCDPRLKDPGAKGMSRHRELAQAGLPMYFAKDDPLGGWSMIEMLLGKKADNGMPMLMVHERCKHLVAYLSSTPRDDKYREDVNPRWIGRSALDALRFGVHSNIRPPQSLDIPKPERKEDKESAWQTTKL